MLKLLVILANSNKERTNDKNQSFVGSMLGYLEMIPAYELRKVSTVGAGGANGMKVCGKRSAP